MKKFLLFTLCLSSLITIFGYIQTAKADYVWTYIDQNADPSTLQNACGVNVPMSPANNCTGQKFPNKSGSQIICCFYDAAQLQAKKVVVQNAINNLSKNTGSTTLFTMPDFEVQIPGLNKLAPVTCVEGSDCSIPWLGQYIAGIYNYALAIVGIIAALVLMGGGLLWLVSGGDASRISQAKELIIGSITGLVIMSASYIILLQVNPNLINLSSINIIPIARIDITPLPSDPSTFAEKCKPVTTGNCAVANMSGFGDKASQASGICMAESGGNANSYNSLTKCTGGEYAVWGLFQFNLSANNFVDANGTTLNCSKAFDKPWTNSKPTCTVINKDLYNACVTAAKNPGLSISNAQILSSNAKTNWGPWEANSKFCKF
jgi:hypothetical protein